MTKITLSILALVMVFGLACFFGVISFRIPPQANQEPRRTWHIGRVAFDLPKSLSPSQWSIELRWPDFYWISVSEVANNNEEVTQSKDDPETITENVSEFLGAEAELFINQGQYATSMKIVVEMPQQGRLIYQINQATDKETFLRRVKLIQSQYTWHGDNVPATSGNLSTHYGEITRADDVADWPDISFVTNFTPAGRGFYRFYFTTLAADDPQGEPLSLEERTFNVVKSLAYSCWCAQKTKPMALAGHPGYEEAKRTIPFKSGAKADMPELWLQWIDASSPEPAGTHPRFSMEIASDDEHSVHANFPYIMSVWESVLPTVRVME